MSSNHQPRATQVESRWTVIPISSYIAQFPKLMDGSRDIHIVIQRLVERKRPGVSSQQDSLGAMSNPRYDDVVYGKSEVYEKKDGVEKLMRQEPPIRR